MGLSVIVTFKFFYSCSAFSKTVVGRVKNSVRELRSENAQLKPSMI